MLLRFTTWLSPGLPLGLFETIAAHVADGLGRRHELSVESKMSGPLSPEDDRFANATTDIGFICPPSYLWLTDVSTPSVELVPLAPVHDDPRTGGRPSYLSDVVGPMPTSPRSPTSPADASATTSEPR